mmetsp:Transcript_98374/g.175152  ORF Transcript_98374/g.175152 Transcript_98374/m.175152 type:complete len:352 (+) Transcript_98374:167-1222(+)
MQPGSPEKFEVRNLSLTDTESFIKLQDLFVHEHLELTQQVYQEVTLRDWQLSLLCPEHVLDEPRGRTEHAESMAKREHESFRNLTILIGHFASRSHQAPEQVGYIMYQVHKGCGRKKKRSPEESPWPFVEVKQLYVCPAYRQCGCGTMLFERMMQALDSQQQADLRLSVLDLNVTATRWYRTRGFVVCGLTPEFLGRKEDSQVIAYQVMQRLSGAPAEEVAQKGPALLFKHEIMGEVINMTYPDTSGSFDVRIVGWLERQRLHVVHSGDLSRWEGEIFEDQIDLNALFRDGHVTFRRNLSLVMRDVEITKQLSRQAKADDSKEQTRSKQDDVVEDLDKEARSRRRLNASLH